jgi:hypothetical protein
MDLRIVQQKSQLFLGYLVLKLLFIMVVRLNEAIEMDESLRVNLKYKKKNWPSFASSFGKCLCLLDTPLAQSS